MRLSAHENITDRKKNENELRKNQQFLRIIFDTTPNLVFVKDDQQRYVMANKALADLFNVPYSEMIGKTDEEIAGYDLGLKEEFRQFCRYDSDVIENQKTVTDVIGFLHDKNAVLKCYRAIKKPILFPDQPTNLLGIAIDVTELEKSREMIVNSELQLRTILDAMHQSIIFLDADMKVLWANSKAIDDSQRSQDTLKGYCCNEIWQKERPCKKCPVRQALKTKQIVVETFQVGHKKTFRIIGCPVVNSTGVK